MPVTSVSRRVRRSGTNWYLPVLIFDDGWTALEVLGSAVKDPIADRRSAPERWARWRKTGGVYEYEDEDGTWAELNDEEHAPLSAGTTLGGTYESLVVSESGDSVFIRSRTIDLYKDSTFSMNASSSSTYEHMPVGAGSYSKDSYGTYAIDGYLLTLRFSDGSVAYRGIVRASEGKLAGEIIYLEDSVYCLHQSDGSC